MHRGPTVLLKWMVAANIELNLIILLIL